MIDLTNISKTYLHRALFQRDGSSPAQRRGLISLHPADPVLPAKPRAATATLGGHPGEHRGGPRWGSQQHYHAHPRADEGEGRAHCFPHLKCAAVLG